MPRTSMAAPRRDVCRTGENLQSYGKPVITHKCVFGFSNNQGMSLAQAMQLPPPDKGSGSNCQWNTQRFGTVQLCKMPCGLMKTMYEIGRRSTPYCHNLPVDSCPDEDFDSCIDKEFFGLAQQHSDDKALHVWKTPDGYLLTDKDTNVFALVHAKGLHFHNGHPQKCSGDGHMLIIAHPPDGPAPMHTFKAVLHNDTCAPYEISRMGSMEHSFRKVLSAIKYTKQPRVVYTSPMGELVARILQGVDAVTVKSSFVDLGRDEGSGMYDERLELHDHLCDLLMLKSASGNLRCIPCANGVIGYRIQKNNPAMRTLVLVANSSDSLLSESPRMDSASNLQIFKLNYSDCNGIKRFVLCDTPEDCESDFDIPVTETVQGILNRVEKVFRDTVNVGSMLHPFEIGANVTQDLEESSSFIDPDAKSTESQRVIEKWLASNLLHG